MYAQIYKLEDSKIEILKPVTGIDEFGIKRYLKKVEKHKKSIDKNNRIIEKYKEKFGEVPNQFAADAYDAVYILKEALDKANCTPDMSPEAICEELVKVFPSLNVDGLTGKGMTWAATGEVSKAPMAIVIKNGEYVTPQ